MKNKAFWRMISEMPPIDWALLAAEQRGYRHTPATIKRFMATKKRNLAIKRKARAKEKPPRPPVRQRLRINSVEVLLGSMETGAWYGRTDIQRLSGLKRGTVATAILRAESLGCSREPGIQRGSDKAAPNANSCIRKHRMPDQLPNRRPNVTATSWSGKTEHRISKH